MKKMVCNFVLWLTVLLCSVLSTSTPARAATSQSLGGLVLEEVSPRIITPNGDQSNDKIFFRFRSSDSLLGIPLETAVFDINGAHVADLTVDPSNDSRLIWDGRDESGNSLPSGIYIYSIKVGKHLATGTVVVAR
jgi:hypothetical protein